MMIFVIIKCSILLFASICTTSHAQQIQDQNDLLSNINSNNNQNDLDCTNGGLITFELITGYVLTSPAETVTMMPGILQLSDCIDRCQKNQTCKALNFETGLCVLLTTAANDQTTVLTPSQFPVFTIFAQKICLNKNYQKCANKGWSFERVLGFELKDKDLRQIQVSNRFACMQACLSEREFICRSANYDPDTGDCTLSDMDRGSINPTHDLKMRTYGPSSGSTEYIENNCIEEPKKLCDFRPIEGKLLKTVDFVYQNVQSIDECREKCLSSPYRCHSFDLGDPNNPNHVCRTSHLDKYSLAHIEDAYLQVNGAITYELHSCYNVSILCKSREMIAHVQTTKIFDGKIYAKSKPNLCVEDIQNSLDFEIRMKYHDVDCDVKEVVHGHFSNDIVIQHHDMIVTTKDLGLSIHCKYDLSNRSITNNVNLSVDGDVDATDSQSAIVSSPNVTMRITDRLGSNIVSAQVGDPLMIRFEIVEATSPYEIFVRELVAVDGQDQSEILLIDSNGCPTDIAIMGAMNKIGGDRKAIEGPFDAFKFPTSETVQFRALVTPCLPTCEPVQCDIRGYDGGLRELSSFGRRRRRRSIRRRSISSNHINNDDILNEEEIIVAKAIQIKDKFAFNGKDKRKNQSGQLQQQQQQDHHRSTYDSNEEAFIVSRRDLISNTGTCLNSMGFIFAGSFFLLAQLVLLLTWACLRSRSQSLLTKTSTLSSPSFSSSSSASWDIMDRSKIIRPTLCASHNHHNVFHHYQQTGKHHV
ncbi:hypothetical protein HUG17_7729 [Dermatophagoides farinae]|uniref:Uncharacterized protein n=2 Tax=Dermatophagoides farinae TaxID=6954 RepID=A0A9D4NXX9_DERFA|nr:hypothetical protein HUG17_7729 [Dermatophagoides farinae]